MVAGDTRGGKGLRRGSGASSLVLGLPGGLCTRTGRGLLGEGGEGWEPTAPQPKCQEKFIAKAAAAGAPGSRCHWLPSLIHIHGYS